MGIRIESSEEEVMKEVARELGLKYSLVKDIVVNGQSKFTAFTMASGSFDSIRWPYFGIFKVKPKHIQVQLYKRGMNRYQKFFFERQVKRGEWKPPEEEREEEGEEEEGREESR